MMKNLKVKLRKKLPFTIATKQKIIEETEELNTINPLDLLTLIEHLPQ